MFRRSRRFVIAALVMLAAVAPAYAYIAPVDVPIIDHFRPPKTKYGAGNRGLEYATSPGAAVVASADGVVTFAGQVGGQLFVTVAHDDGLRTTYGYLQSISVTVGSRVTQGEQVGTAGNDVQFDVRKGDQYIDPESILSNGQAHLVPVKP